MGNTTMIFKLSTSICFALAFMALSPSGCSAQSTSSGAPRQSARIRVDLPPGWQSLKPPVRTALQFAEYPDLAAYFELVIEPKSDFADNVDLMAWAKLVRENTAKASKLVNRKDTECRERKINGQATVEYEVTGESKGVKFHFRNILLQHGDYYCKLACWTTPSHWEDAQAKFDELVGRLK
jgi:hypothetical protein